MKPELEQLRALLEKEELYATEIAKRMKCSMPAVYRRLHALARAGAVIVESREPRTKPGPTPTRYRLAKSQVQIPRVA